ncbi:MAG: restriction endonuclease subunit S [Bacteroidetes bacterium]|nr:restriction endonuclease subunit S [Bacteroidota bacterium]
MTTHLKNISNIQTGLFAKPQSDGDIVYLQPKYFNELGELTTVLMPDLNSTEISEKHLLKPGDILFAAKGSKNFAACFEKHNLPAVASTSFFVIRVTNQKVLPEYLTWFLNHPNTQQFLKGYARGTAMVSISKAVLEDINVSIPSIEMQKRILKIDSYRKQELALKKQMEDLQEKYLQSLLIKSTQK